MSCPQCHGCTYSQPFPRGYFGPGQGHLLYLYAKLLASDPRYGDQGTRVWLCDACRLAGLDPAASRNG